ncbi:MAG: molecular chaperone TorD family protein [Egibacteraceae bacterium]
MRASHADDREDLPTQLVAHSLAYAFLSRVTYEEPGEDLLCALTAEGLPEAWPVCPEEPAVVDGLALLHEALRAWGPADVAALRRDHRRLFVGPGRVLAPPWESVYRSTDHLVFDVQTAAVRAFYGRFGLQAPNLQREPDDHLGLELAFMLHLATSALSALERADEAAVAVLLDAQRDFLAEHLLRWAPACFARMDEHADTAYFRGVARLGEATLRGVAGDLGVPEADDVAAGAGR